MKSIITVLLLAVACGGERASVRDPSEFVEPTETGIKSERRRSLDDIKRMTALSSFALTCDPPKWAGACGLLADQIEDEYVKKFVKGTCHEDPNAPATPGCIAEFRDSFTYKLRKRYSLAREVDVRFQCKKSSNKCETLGLLEIEWLNSHNLRVQHAFEIDAEEIEATADAKQIALEQVRAQMERQRTRAAETAAANSGRIADAAGRVADDIAKIRQCYVWGC